ncbi:MAG: tRNA uridine-5-carboxymethylaminomethyl(34) synthesis GTPase MnmE [Thermodesulfobacteriota bacterium]
MSTNQVYEQDTIAAIATAQGPGGIAVIRVSGQDCTSIIQRIFTRNSEMINPSEMQSHHMYHGQIVDKSSKTVIDEVLCVVMRSPSSYTGENMAEIHSHGGYLAPKKILDLIYKSGARAAKPGEFTLRAYLNGKMDLAQAEAVTDVINAQTQEGLKQAEMQLEGALSKRIDEYKDIIADILAEIEAQVDFPEEDIDSIVKDRLEKQSQGLIDKINHLINTYEHGRILKDGVNTAIIGKPNVGKSSLLNQMIMKERAIVSPIPGTTRDFIEESVDIGGIALKLTDTAGIRTSSDEIENIGVGLAKKKAEQAELIIAVIDSSSELDGNDKEILDHIKDKKAVLVLNKADIATKTTNEDTKTYIDKVRTVETSAKLGTGINELKATIKTVLSITSENSEASEIVLTELRHKTALERSCSSLKSFLAALKDNSSPEFLALDARIALESLGEITGEVTTEDILGRIFNKFCIGK